MQEPPETWVPRRPVNGLETRPSWVEEYYGPQLEPGTLWTKARTVEWLGQPRNFNELHIRVAENQTDRNHIKEVTDLVQDKIEKSGRTVLFTGELSRYGTRLLRLSNARETCTEQDVNS